eukprot:5997010-Karenia_brevis.AAC.1
MSQGKETSKAACSGEAASTEQEWEWIEANVNTEKTMKGKKYPNKTAWLDAYQLIQKLRRHFNWPVFKAFLENEADFANLDVHRTVYLLNMLGGILISNSFKDKTVGKKGKSTIGQEGMEVIFLEAARFIVKQASEQGDDEIPPDSLPSRIVGSGRKVPNVFEGKANKTCLNMLNMLRAPLHKDTQVWKNVM